MEKPSPYPNETDLLEYVDPNIGSVHGRWFFYTPASNPFGMAKPAPHTNAYGSLGGWGPVGYDDRHTSIEGFGMFHEFQIGGVVFMPTTGTIQTIPGTLENPDDGYRSRFDKSSERASPGYYRTTLKDYGISVELTSTERVAFQQYIFPESNESHVVLDLGHRQGESSDIVETEARIVDTNQIEGFVVTYPEYAKFCQPGGRVKMYFHSQLSKSPASIDSFVDSLLIKNQPYSKGIGSGLVLNFETAQNDTLLIKTGLSYTSIDNAKNNLKKEGSGISFSTARQNAENAWRNKLGVIKVEGSSLDDRKKFYTGLYHALLGRGLASDVNGHYPTNDPEVIGQLPLDQNGDPEYHHYNTDGIWGGFWNLGQLWALAYPDYLRDYVQSNIDFYKESGYLHDGVAAGVHTNGVQTNFQGLFIASAYNAGIRDFEIENGYKAAYENEVKYNGRPFGPGKYDLSYFVKNGYVHWYDTTLSNGWVFNFGASHTLEYAYSSYAVAQMAKALGRDEDFNLLMKQSHNWKNIFDDETKFIRPRHLNGDFVEPFDPMEPWKGFQEGNAYQYTWYVPHDVEGLIDKVGKELFTERLNKMFVEAQKSIFGGGEEIDSFSGLQKLYNHGNQPCLHDVWLFNYVDQPWQTQKWSRAILDEFYGVEGLHGYGYGQDEDQGQLGAWYVMASMGIFDVQGHADTDPRYQLGSPLFDKISIKLDPNYYKGDYMTIETVNNSKTNKYIKSVVLNGKPIASNSINRSDLVNGGTLVFEMDSIPAK